jgi:CRP/FNR family transcriptional regulator, cyclic AMP receptor protein
MTEINIFRHSPDARDLGAGDVLFEQGDAGDAMFAVVEGRVELSREGHVIEDVGPGGILGEMALIDPAPRTATAIARTPARVVAVDEKHFTYLVQEHPTFAMQVLRVMAERLRRTNEAAPGFTG